MSGARLTRRASLAAALALGALVACTHRQVAVKTLAAGAHCPPAAGRPAAAILDGADAWRRVFRSALLEDRAAPLPVDFAKELVVLVTMGERPTGGYAVELARPEAKVADGVAEVRVALRAPPKGALVTQALTSPCLALALPREGIREVRIVDEQGAEIAIARAR